MYVIVSFALDLRTEADLEVTGSTNRSPFKLPEAENPDKQHKVSFTQTFQVKNVLPTPIQGVDIEVKLVNNES